MSNNVKKQKVQKLYLDSAEQGSGRALKPFYISLIAKGKIDKKNYLERISNLFSRLASICKVS